MTRVCFCWGPTVTLNEMERQTHGGNWLAFAQTRLKSVLNRVATMHYVCSLKQNDAIIVSIMSQSCREINRQNVLKRSSLTTERNAAKEIPWSELSCYLSCVTLWPRPGWNFKPIVEHRIQRACAVSPRGIERTQTIMLWQYCRSHIFPHIFG